MYKVLLLEDSPEYHLIVKHSLGAKFEVTIAASLAEARVEISQSRFDVIIIDVTLPDGDGFQFCSELMKSEEHNKAALIMLTGKTGLNDRVLGWTVGADDYITKPFEPFEFQVRVESKIQKSRSRTEQADVFQRGQIKLNLGFHEASIVNSAGERKLSLTPNEFKLLHCLLKNQDRVLSRAQLLQSVWGTSTFVSDRTVDKHISALRQKMEDQGHCLITVPGFGYKFSLQTAA
jgi:two-component system phosphate regulon response regulator PhoB